MYPHNIENKNNMKKLVFFTIVLALTASFGQQPIKDQLTIEKGTWLLNGNLSFSYSNSESENFESNNNESNAQRLNISPTIGYAFSTDWLAGVGIGFGYGNFKNTSIIEGQSDESLKSKQYAFDLFPYVRKYLSVGKNLSFFLQGEVRYTKLWSDFEQENFQEVSENSNNLFTGLRPGFTFFIVDKFALETTIGSFGYSRTKSERDGQYRNSSDFFGISLNSSDLLFGLSYYF